MDNRQKIRNTFDTKLDKDKIYNNIIKSDEAKYINFFKISLAPICVVVAVIILGTLVTNNKDEKNIDNNVSEIRQNNIKDKKDSDSEEEMNDFVEFIGTCEDVKFNELIKEEERLSKIKFPNDVKELRCMKNYELADPNSSVVIYREKHKLRGKFAGYYLIFGGNDKYMEIFTSKNYEYKLSDCLDGSNFFNECNIMGIKFKIRDDKQDNRYRILFKYDNLYWDIETYNITQQELIELISSIIF